MFAHSGPPSAPNGPLNPMEILERSMVVDWQAPDDDGGSSVTGYRLEARKVCIIYRTLTDFTDTNSKMLRKIDNVTKTLY